MPWLWLLFVPAFCYQILSIVAIVRFLLRCDGPSLEASFLPPVSVLKPVRGLDPNTYEAFVSQAKQDYPDFELLFGVRDSNDPAIPAIRRLQSEFSGVVIRLVVASTEAPNGKVGTLIDLGRAARHGIWVVNDSDIKVEQSYLRAVVGPLADPEIGIVTCPYRAHAHSIATRWEAFGIATDFIPSAMVAQQIGVRDFGLGSTLAFRADDLKASGGFEAVAAYLADDYQLARRIAAGGKRALLSRQVVETSLGEGTWSGVWQHQVRWARTIRRSKGGGYAGLPIAQTGLWVVLAVGCGALVPAAVLSCLRVGMALLAALALRSGQDARLSLLAPVWDLFAFSIWISAWVGNHVQWRDQRLRLNSDGTIRVKNPSS